MCELPTTETLLRSRDQHTCKPRLALSALVTSHTFPYKARVRCHSNTDVTTATTAKPPFMRNTVWKQSVPLHVVWSPCRCLAFSYNVPARYVACR